MTFCEKCGAIMALKNIGRGKFLGCACGHIQPLGENKKESITSKEIEVIDLNKNHLAVYDHKCKHCGYEKAELISRGIWYSDEDEALEYVCGRCGKHEKVDNKIK